MALGDHSLFQKSCIPSKDMLFRAPNKERLEANTNDGQKCAGKIVVLGICSNGGLYGMRETPASIKPHTPLACVWDLSLEGAPIWGMHILRNRMTCGGGDSHPHCVLVSILARQNWWTPMV